MSALLQVSRCMQQRAARASKRCTSFKIPGTIVATAQRAGLNRRSFCASDRKDDAQGGAPTRDLKDGLEGTSSTEHLPGGLADETPKYPCRPATWKPFMTELLKPTDGCWRFTDGRELKAIPFEESFKVLEKHFESEAVAWVIGAPGCGKTSLGRTFVEHMTQKGWTAQLRTSADISKPSLRTFRANHLMGLRGPKTTAKVLMVIDECQAIKVWGTIHDLLIKNSPMKLLLLGTDHPASTKAEFTPQALGDNKFWMFAPTVERKTVCEFLRSALDLHEVPPSRLRDRWCNSIFDMCGGNLDMILTSMRLLIETGNYPTTYNLLKKKPRTVANGGDDWEVEKVKLARRVCAVGATTVGPESTGRQFVRRGFLMPVRIDHVGSGLVKAKPGDYTELSWATALQRDYAVICQKVSPLPTKEVQGAGVRKPLDLLLRLLPMVDVTFLVTGDIAGTGASSATEYHIQAAMLVAASKICPQGTLLNEWPIGNFRLDFLYIHDDENRWGFEITRNGSDVDGHMKRFEDGPYTAACSDWLVVDFCTSPSSVLAPSKPKLVRISPHASIGWDAFTVSFDNKTVHVPRNGIPQYLVADDTSQLQVKSCMEIKPGGGSSSQMVWVQFLKCNDKANQNPFVLAGDAFKVKGSFGDIDDLKNGIAEKRKYDSSLMLVYRKDEKGTWKRLLPDEEVVLENTRATAYGFTIATNST